MKDQLQTLREAVNELHNSFPEKERALTALAQLEAMVVEQKPIWYHKHWGLQDDIFYSANEKVPEGATPLFAAPVAQQPQAEAVPPGYAGVMVWLGDRKVVRVVTKVEIDHEREAGLSLKFHAETAIAAIAQQKGGV